MASTSVQSRVSEFEARRFHKLASQNLLETPLSPSASNLTPILPQITPPKPSRSPSPSPPNLGRKTSLIDLKDWIVDEGSRNHSPSSRGNSSGFLNTRKPAPARSSVRDASKTHNATPLINLQPPLNPKTTHESARASQPPPLPPRQSSYSPAMRFAGPPSSPSDISLNVDAPHTYPPPFNLTLPASANTLTDGNSRNGLGFGHAPASSISSFHSVSLSSDGGTSADREASISGSASNLTTNFPADLDPADRRSSPAPTNRRSPSGKGPSGNVNGGHRRVNGLYELKQKRSNESDIASLDESYENVSTSSCGSPSAKAAISLDWERATAKSKKDPLPYTPRSLVPPKLPARPASTSASISKKSAKPSPSVSPTPRSVPASPSMSSASSVLSSGSTSSSATSSMTAGGSRRRPPPPPPQSSYPPVPVGALVLPPTSIPSRPPPIGPFGGSSRTGSSMSWASTGVSDRSSLLTTSPNTSRSSLIPVDPASSCHPALSPGSNNKTLLLRPTPIPAAARRRYERLFDGNVVQARKADHELQKLLQSGVRFPSQSSKPARLQPEDAKGLRTRQAAGWRGLSVDLIPGLSESGSDEGHESDDDGKWKRNRTFIGMEDVEEEEWEDIGPRAKSDERLDSYVVRSIWSKSRLDRHKLRDIWLECDSTNTGSLTRESFINGMWRIDEELRRARLRSSATTGMPLRSGNGLPASFLARKDNPSPNSRAPVVARHSLRKTSPFLTS